MKLREPSVGLLDRILNSVSECFTVQTARALIKLRQDKQVRDRMEELAAKASEGSLTPEESRQYQTLIEVCDLIATLQLKARHRLASGAV